VKANRLSSNRHLNIQFVRCTRSGQITEISVGCLQPDTCATASYRAKPKFHIIHYITLVILSGLKYKTAEPLHTVYF